MATNYSTYPEALDGYSTLPLRRDGVHEIVAADVNRLRDAIVKIEQELGTQPSGTYGTVRARLDSVTDASAHITAHLADTSDAHDASAISVLDSSGNFTSTDVEGVMGELAATLPAAPDTIGNDNTSIPNSGIPDFVSGPGARFGINTSSGSILLKTQPILITGVRIIEIGDLNSTGTGYLRMSSLGNIEWMAPGDSFGTSVDITGLSEGDITTLSSGTATKKIRIARDSNPLPVSFPLTDTFEITTLSPEPGSFSILDTEIRSSNYITRTASSAIGTSQNQFMISGMIYPADKGTLVLQRKRRGDSDFYPIATLDLSDNFTESLRTTGQPTYCPTLTNYDTITLYDRYPARKDYENLGTDSNGNQLYSNFSITSTFGPHQVAKYLIPASNSDISGGTLSSPGSSSVTEINTKVSAYRLVHYNEDYSGNFTGDPTETDIYSLADALGGVTNDGYNNVRMSNVYLDSDTARPTISQVVLRPVTPSSEILPRFISGVNYYNSADDLFDIELRTGANAFSKVYKSTGYLTFATDVFTFPSGSGFGTSVDITEMMDDGYVAFSSSNTPTMTERGYYIANASINPTRRIYPSVNQFSTNAFVSATLHDPFGDGTAFDAYGLSSSNVRILVNSYDRNRATNTQEWFTDESRRVGTSETFNFKTERGQYTSDYGANGDGYTVGVWNETIPLSIGELQCGGRFLGNDFGVAGLIYPQSDYSSGISPVQAYKTNFDIDGYLSSDPIYQRLFNLGYSCNNYRLRIKSGGASLVSFNDIWSGNSSGRSIVIRAKIPGTGSNSTGFLDIGKLFETGMYQNDDGCLFGAIQGGSGDFTVPITFGTRNSSDSQGMIAIQIKFLANMSSTNKLKTITMMELLPF